MTSASAPAARREHRAAMVAVATGVGLLLLKLGAWWLTGSSAVFSDALESIVNVVASLAALWAIRSAHRPADRTHPYGHGRFELLAAALEGGMILVAAAVILWKSTEVVLSGDIRLRNLDAGLIVLTVTIAANGAVGAWLYRLGRRTGSPALSADGQHLLTDAVTTAAAIAALLLVRATGATWIDPLAAIIMGLALGVIGFRLVRRALGDLVDEQDPRDFERVSAVLEAHRGAAGIEPRICSWHKLRVRHLGREHWVEFHARVPARTDIRTAHAQATRIEEEIERLLGPGNATAHVEPCDEETCPICRR